MIKTEIRGIIEDSADNGERLNELVDQFRLGRDVTDLLSLLNSENPELVAIGAWILGELPLELYDSELVLSPLRKLTEHIDPAVRFQSLGALFPSLDREQSTTRDLLRKMCDDPNIGVRESARAAAARLNLDR